MTVGTSAERRPARSTASVGSAQAHRTWSLTRDTGRSGRGTQVLLLDRNVQPLPDRRGQGQGLRPIPFRCVEEPREPDLRPTRQIQIDGIRYPEVPFPDAALHDADAADVGERAETPGEI